MVDGRVWQTHFENIIVKKQSPPHIAYESDMFLSFLFFLLGPAPGLILYPFLNSRALTALTN